MIKYIFRRLIQVAITVWIIATITFLAIRLAPGDPASVMIGQIGTVYEYESVSKQLGLDRPLYIQYLEYIGGIIIGLVEAAGTGCVPYPQKASSYIPAYGMIVLTLMLLLRPTGLLGRRFASGTHGKL